MPQHHSLTDLQFSEISDLFSSGRKIEAIKRYREITGAGLADAKREVEQLQERPPRASVPKENRLEEVTALVRSGKKIEAIKRYRELMGIGLAEAKKAVEAMEDSVEPSSGHPHAQSTGCGTSVFVVAAVLAATLGWIFS